MCKFMLFLEREQASPSCAAAWRVAGQLPAAPALSCRAHGWVTLPFC